MSRWVLVTALIAAVFFTSLHLSREARALEDRFLALFQKLDGNSDQRVDRTEFKKRKTSILFMPRGGESEPELTYENTLVSRAEFDAADHDGDGVLSSLEWITAPFADFSRIDSNSDQAISIEEFGAFANEVLR